MITLEERQAIIQEVFHLVHDSVMSDLRVSGPGILQSFNAAKQTATVQLALKEKIKQADGTWKWVTVTLLVDCPVKMQRGGGWVTTHPLKKGDEGLVVFGDRDMDAWWQSGGVQQYIRGRKHDLSDGYFLPGITSQANPVQNYSTTSTQIRSEDGTVVMDLATTGMTHTAPIVTITGATKVVINGNGQTTIEGKVFLQHKHSGVATGSGDSGGVF